MSGPPSKNLWPTKADFEYEMENWGYTHTTLNKHTDMLIVAKEDLGTLKCQKAEKYNIPIYTYEEAFQRKDNLYKRVIRNKKLINLLNKNEE